MGSNKDFVKKLRDAKTQWARFCLCDFHVHSPASYDVRGSRYSELSPEEQELLKDVSVPSATCDLAAHEVSIIDAYPIDTYYKRLLNRRNDIATQQGLTEAEDWAIVAITDHDVCEYSSLLSQKAWDERKTDRLLVLPAVELDISFSIAGSTETTTIHLLTIFSPCTASSDIRVAISYASEKNWKPGNRLLEVDDLPKFIHRLRHHQQYPAICIAAHVSSKKGVQSETKKKLLGHRDAEIVALENTLIHADEVNKKEIQKDIELLKLEVDLAASTDVLKIIGECGFDGLQISKASDGNHYHRLHRFRDEYGRSTPLVCSDAHVSSGVFDAGEGAIPHLKVCQTPGALSASDWLIEIRKAIRCGETRFTHSVPGRVSKWIEGIEVIPDAGDAANFWPTSGGLVLPFSRNLNCLIGGRGSGKSSVIEAIGFLTKPEDYLLTPKEREKSDCYKRANATLQGCKIKLRWNSNNVDGESSIPAGGLFVTRYFDAKHSHLPVGITDKDDKTVTISSIPSVQLYRFKDIETKADDKGLRELFDDVCGGEVKELSGKIDSCVAELIDQRSSVIPIARKITELTQDGSPLRKYVASLLDYNRVNKPEVQEHYESLDKIEFASKVAASLSGDWDNIRELLDNSGIEESVLEFFERFVDECHDENGLLLPHFEQLNDLLNEQSPESSLKKKVLEELKKLEGSMDGVRASLATIVASLGSKYQTDKDSLVSQGLPVGSSDREAKKAALDAAKEALEHYRVTIIEYNKVCEDRKNIFERLLKYCQRRTELREHTAQAITTQLSRDLDRNVLVVEAQAQAMAERSEYFKWLNRVVAPHFLRYKSERLNALVVRNNLMPSELRKLLHRDQENISMLIVDEEKAKDGAISESDAETIISESSGRFRIEPEVHQDGVDGDVWSELPAEIKEGLWTFPEDNSRKHEMRLSSVLELDEIVFDDVPKIFLNDRPLDGGSTLRPLEELSPGQRCSAILPILLLNGDSPLIIDQPEDNLDNRLIRQVIVNVLATIKLRRQVIVATHNPNLPVLGDAEQTVALKAIDENKSLLESCGNLDQPEIVGVITDVMEGGREAFQYRQTIYQQHWQGNVEV